MNKDQILFTPSSLLDILSNIDELHTHDINVTESSSGDIYLRIGEHNYKLDASQATDVSVDNATLNEVNEINEDGYDSVENVSIETDPDKIESGIIKEFAKTLLVGGLVRLSAKLLRGDKR